MSQSHFFANTVLATINLMRLAAKEGMPAGGHSDELFSLAFGIAGQEIHPIGTSTTNYLYDGRYLVEEIDQTANVVSRYTDGPKIDEPLSEFRVGTISYYEQDGIGSVSSLTNSTGTTAATYGYDTFGNLSASTGSLANSLRYAGREFDSESGLYYYRARFYDPLNGRFLSEDPIRSSGGLNFFAYVRNDPSDLIDPSGLAPQWWNDIRNILHPPSPQPGTTTPGPPCINPFDTNAFVNWMNGHASGANHGCAKAVRMGLQAGFGQTPTNENTWGLPVPAKDYGPALTGLGFTDVTDDPNYTTQQPGDIAVMQPVPGVTNENGHIAVWNGSQWVSDYMQNNFQPYSGVTINDFRVYRYPSSTCGN